MKLIDAIKVLEAYDKKGRFVYKNQDLAKLLHSNTTKALAACLSRLTEKGVLIRAIKGVYVYGFSEHKTKFILEHIAKAMRRGEYTYVSLESILSEYGVISQIPIDRLTLMTTGRKGEYKTPFGVIELTHTKRSINDILINSVDVYRPLRIATKHAALRDLYRVGRNTHLIDKGLIDDD